MPRILPKPGDYIGRRNGPMVIKQEESGAVGVYIDYSLLNSGVQFSGTTAVYIMKKDGTAQKGALDNLRKVFPQWDSADPFDLEAIPVNEDPNVAEFRLDQCHIEDYTPPTTQEEPNPQPITTFKVGWINPLEGGSRGMPTPMSVDERKAFIAKNGAKLRALLGGKPAAPAASKPSPASRAGQPKSGASEGPPSRRTGSAPVGGQPRTSSENEVWTAYFNAHKDDDGENQETLGEKFWQAAKEALEAAGKDIEKGDTPTPAMWGQIAETLGV